MAARTKHLRANALIELLRSSRRSPATFEKSLVREKDGTLASRYAEEVFAPRHAFADNEDWRKRCGGILRCCGSIYCLLTQDRELSAGCYAEAAYAFALGLPVHAISWQLRGKPKVELGGGEIVALWDWTWWRAAQYRPAGRGERVMCEFRKVATGIETASTTALAALRVRLPWPKEKAAG